MKSHYLVMMVSCSLYYSSASSHIVTPEQKDLRVCSQRLANLYNLICGFDNYGDVSGDEISIPLTIKDIFKRKYWKSKKEEFFTKCCMAPCSYVEITKLC